MDIKALKQQATTIRDEQNRSANTAARVGRAMLETVNAIEENSTAIAANTANIATHKSDLTDLKAFYHGDLGNFASWTEATAALDAMVTAPSANGQYQIRIGLVPFIVNFTCISTGSNIYVQSVTGAAAIKSDGTIVTTHGKAVNIFSRSYADSAWGAWTRLADVSEVPVVQTNTNGSVGQYIYASDTDSTKYVLSGVGKVFQNGGNLKLRFKLWGSGNTSYDDGKCKTLDFPRVTSGADGVMNHNVYGRVLNHSIYIGTNTQTTVNINYTDFAASGKKTLAIGPATTAKAGCMTVAHVNALNSLASHIVDLGDFENEYEALKAIGQLGVSNNRDLVHAHLTYHADNSSSKTTLILIQSIEGKQCRQYIFNKCKVFSRLIHFTDETLSEHEFTGDWTFMFADRLTWNNERHSYTMNQFGTDYGKDYTDPIPMASATADGLMSKDDYALLQKIKAQLNL